MKILFIGNSYTYYNDLPQLFQKLAEENGQPTEAYSVTCGGRYLIENLEKEDEYSAKMDALLSQHVFDCVILQEHSLGSILTYEGFCKGIAGLREKIGSRGRQYMLYSTWGRKPGSPTLEEHGWTQESMTAAVAEGYRRAGEALDIPVSFVGLKFFEISSSHPEIDLFASDLTHPSYAGSCLAAITLFVSLFGVYPRNTESMELSADTLQAFRALF